MKTFRLPLVLALLTGVALHAQNAAPLAAPPAPEGALRTTAELEQLLAPIALYPDPLIALVLAAAAVPTDVVLAARHVRENGTDRSQIEHRAWDDSVKSLTHYPDVLKWMDENLPWTKQVGEAFALQAADVMQVIQSLRAKARAAGTLVDTPQQQVIAEPQVIRIVPAQPDVIYVPYYQPEVVFVDRPAFYSHPVVTFGFGAAVGSWLAYDCDWRHRTLWVGNRHRPWTGHDWRRPVVTYSTSYTRAPVVRKWQAPASYHRPPTSVSHRQRNAVVRPTSFASIHTRNFTPRIAAPGHSDRRHVPPPGVSRGPSGQRHTTHATVQPPTTAVAPQVRWTPRSTPTVTTTTPPSIMAPSYTQPTTNHTRPHPNTTTTHSRPGPSRNVRSGTIPTYTRPTSTPLQMSTNAPRPQSYGSRGHDRSQSNRPTTPTLPMVSRASAPSTHPVAPSTRGHSYSNASSPRTRNAPSLPMAAPPASTVTTGPVVTSAPPASQPAQARSADGHPSRGNGRRHSDRR